MIKTTPINTTLCSQDVGSDTWWRSIVERGTPLQISIDDDNDLVSFIWRDPAGKDSNIQKVYIDLYSKTPHPTEQLTSFTRINNSDVWYWETPLPNDWLGSYFIMPATQQQSPPACHTRKLIRQWWIQLMGIAAQADPLNKRAPHSNGNGIALSSIDLTNSNNNVLKTYSEKPQYQPQKSQWKSHKLNNTRQIWLYKTGSKIAVTTEKTPLVLLLDGQYWADNMPIYAALDALTRDDKLPPALYVFIDSINGITRNKELGCNKTFVEAIEHELLPWINTQYSISYDPYQTIIAGQSLGGLCALFASLNFPHRFASSISQSGSFWWPDVHAKPGEGELIQQLEKLDISPALNIIIEAGCYEKDMLKDSQLIAKALEKKGHYVNYHEYRGGHDWLCWQLGLLRSLTLAFSTFNVLSDK